MYTGSFTCPIIHDRKHTPVPENSYYKASWEVSLIMFSFSFKIEICFNKHNVLL